MGSDFNNLKLPTDNFINLLFKCATNFDSRFVLRNQSLSKVLKVMKLYEEKYGGTFLSNSEDNSESVTSSCPNKNLHSQHKTHSRSREFSIKYFLKSNTVVGGCFHRSCLETNNLILEKLFDIQNELVYRKRSKLQIDVSDKNQKKRQDHLLRNINRGSIKSKRFYF